MTAQRISPVSATGAPVTKKGRFAVASSRTPYSCARAAAELPTLFCGKDGSPLPLTALISWSVRFLGRKTTVEIHGYLHFSCETARSSDWSSHIEWKVWGRSRQAASFCSSESFDGRPVGLMSIRPSGP
jgi:hypothetical protein